MTRATCARRSPAWPAPRRGCWPAGPARHHTAARRLRRGARVGGGDDEIDGADVVGRASPRRTPTSLWIGRGAPMATRRRVWPWLGDRGGVRLTGGSQLWEVAVVLGGLLAAPADVEPSPSWKCRVSWTTSPPSRSTAPCRHLVPRRSRHLLSGSRSSSRCVPNSAAVA